MSVLGGIEFGGTKIVCAVGQPGRVDHEIRFATGTDPLAAMAKCLEFFTAHGPIEALGVGAFGPCDPDPNSPTYGHITTTPKPGWSNFDVLGALSSGLPDVPIAFDTDVNVAALGEAERGAAIGLPSVLYLTIGTGIGAGIMVDHRLVHGLVHPEVGHVRLPRPVTELQLFKGVCPYHGDCFEGVAAGPAMAARWGAPAEQITTDHAAFEAMWDLQADYVAIALHMLVCVVSPQRIVVGGGVGGQEQLLSRVRPRLLESLAGYVVAPALEREIDSYVVTPALGNQSGVLGAMELGSQQLQSNYPPRT